MTTDTAGTSKEIRITGPQETIPADIANAWCVRLRDRLAERYPGPYTVAWTEDKEAPARTPAGLRHWLTLRREGTLQGRISLAWDQTRPGLVRIRTEVASLPAPDIRIGGLLDVLDWVLGAAGFGLWIWFVVGDWRRVWNRVSTFASGYDATHATKLEVFWLMLGWALSPAIAVMLVEFLRARIEILAEAWQRRRVRAFTRKDLDRVLDSLVQEVLNETTRVPEVCLALGQAHPGQPHPIHLNLVWAAGGKYNPAEGFRWASEDPSSLDVVPAGD